MGVSYSNIKFISRKGRFFDTQFRASVDVTTKSGMLWFKKESVKTVEIYSMAVANFKFLDTGEFTPIKVDRLISIHNATCDDKERLKY